MTKTVLYRVRKFEFFTILVASTAQNDTSGEIGVSSLIDTWIVVRELEENEGKTGLRRKDPFGSADAQASPNLGAGIGAWPCLFDF